MLSLHKLEIFAKVMAIGSFSGAANQLFMSQPAVSKHIQDLEATLGTQLFERAGSRGVIPTEAGLELYDYTQQILKLVMEAESKLTTVENIRSGQITLGVTQGVGIYLFPRWMRTFGNRYPNLTLSINSGTTNKIVRGVLNGQLQVGFVEGEIDDIQDKRLSSFLLHKIDMVVVVGKSHSWWGRKHIPLKELDGQPYISRQPNSRTRIWTDGFFTRYGVKPRIIAEFDSSESIKSSAANTGVAILPSYSIQREVQLGLLCPIAIQDAPMYRELKLIWNNETPFDPITRAFLMILDEEYPQIRRIFND